MFDRIPSARGFVQLVFDGPDTGDQHDAGSPPVAYDDRGGCASRLWATGE